MNGIQIYAIVLLVLGVVLNMGMAGEKHEMTFGVKHFLISLAVSAPIYGRIFGWW